MVHDEAEHSRLSFYIDGAHTPESMESCASWFAEASSLQVPCASSPPMHQWQAGCGVPDLGCLQAAQQQAAQHTGHTSSGLHTLQRVLLFSCQQVGPRCPVLRISVTGRVGVSAQADEGLSLQERDPEQLLGSLQRALQARQAPVEHALFVPLDSSSFTVQVLQHFAHSCSMC